MLQQLLVTKIFEGGIDLVTGEHISHGLVISNGKSEVLISVTPEDVERLALLICGDEEKTSEESSTKQTPNVRVITKEPAQDPVETEEKSVKEARLSLVRPGPGSSYDDELTGVSSL